MRTKKWSIPDDFDTENGQYRLAVLCVPDSPKWRGTVRGLINELTFGRNWDERTGSILGVLEIARQIDESYDMTCGEEIKRIADILEQWYDRSYVNFFDLKALLEASGLTGITFWLEAFEEIGDLLGVLPDLNITIPTDQLLNMMMTVMYRRRLFDKVDNINASLQGLIISESGPSAPVILDALQTLIPGQSVADNILGDLDEAIASIPATLITALLGNYVTNRQVDIRQAIEGIEPTDVSGIVDSLQGIISHCNLCGSTGCDCPPAYGDIDPPELAETGTPQTDPPPPTFPTWSEYFDHKCAAANRIADDYIATLDNFGNTQPILLSLPIAIIGSFLGSSLSFGLAKGLMQVGYGTGESAGIVISALVNLFTASPSYLTRLGEMGDAMEAAKQTLVCDLFQATTTAAAATAVQDFQNSIYPLLTYGPGETQAEFSGQANRIRNRLFTNSVLNYLFEFDQETADIGGSIDCATCDTCNEYLFLYGSFDGIDTFSSQIDPLGTGAHILFFHYNVTDGIQTCGPTIGTLSISNISGHTDWSGSPPGKNDDFRFSSSHVGLGEDCTGWDVYCSDIDPSPVEFNNVRTLNIRSSTPFTLTATVQ